MNQEGKNVLFFLFFRQGPRPMQCPNVEHIKSGYRGPLPHAIGILPMGAFKDGLNGNWWA